MRKKTVKFCASTLFWYILYLLPIILAVVQYISFQNWNGQDFMENQDTFMGLLNYNLYNFDIDEGGFISSALRECFGSLFFAGGGSFYTIYNYMDYFCGCVILHVAVDFILFIPRLCHKWLNAFTRSEDCE